VIASIKKYQLEEEAKIKRYISSSSTVALIQSEKDNAADINYKDIKSMVTESIQLAGGFDNIIEDGDVVILKPNIMCLWIVSTREQLPPNCNGVTTDWRITKAISELVREQNPNGKIYVAESAAFQETKMAMDSLNYTKEYMPEIDSFICLENSGGYEEWNSPLLAKITLPDGVGTYPDFMKPNKSPEFYMNRTYYEADVIICIPVLKNHLYAGLTGAVKCVGMGSTPPNIYGSWDDLNLTGATAKMLEGKVPKVLILNRSRKINHAPFFLDMWLSDYYMCKPVDFVVTDGLNGIQNGPDLNPLLKAGDRKDHLMNMRLVLAGNDALAVDVIHSLLIGMDPYKINHLALLSNKNMGQLDPARIKVAGNRHVHEVKKKFELKFPIRGGTLMYDNFNSPEMTVISADIRRHKLYLSLDTSNKIIKVEVAIDGNLLDVIAVDNFNELEFDLSHITTTKEQITVFAYDRFLNCAVKEIALN
jgi:uncharacterized protein (DUF362 family)